MKQEKFIFLILLLSNGLYLAAQTWYNPNIDQEVERLLKQMTVEEKLNYIGGTDWMYTKDIDRLGIHRIKMSDGPLGVVTNTTSTALPATVMLAATWNDSLAYKYGKAIGEDCSKKCQSHFRTSCQYIQSPYVWT